MHTLVYETSDYTITVSLNQIIITLHHAHTGVAIIDLGRDTLKKIWQKVLRSILIILCIYQWKNEN